MAGADEAMDAVLHSLLDFIDSTMGFHVAKGPELRELLRLDIEVEDDLDAVAAVLRARSERLFGGTIDC